MNEWPLPRGPITRAFRGMPSRADLTLKAQSGGLASRGGAAVRALIKTALIKLPDERITPGPSPVRTEKKVIVISAMIVMLFIQENRRDASWPKAGQRRM